MRKALLVVVLLATSFTVSAKMSEAECYNLQTEIHKHADKYADSEDTTGKGRHIELSIKLTEECGYLMTDEVLKKRREYNYLLHQQLNK